MSLLTQVVLPLASLILSVCTWRLAYKQGWNQILPIFSRYIVFYCISTAVLLGISYCSLYPGRMQQSICLLYAYGYSSFGIILNLFILVVLYELIRYTSRNGAEGQARVIAIFELMAVAAAFIFAIKITAASGAPNYCLRLGWFASALGEVTKLIIFGLFVAMIVLKRIRELRWGKGIALILVGTTQVFVVDFALNVAIHKGYMKNMYGIIVRISGFVWWVLWWLAVRKAPEISATQPRAAAVPAN